MAKAHDNLILKNFSGQIGKQLVVKQYGGKIVLTAYPDMRKKEPTPLVNLNQNQFREAVKYSRSITSDKQLKAKYAAKLPPGKRVCDYAVSEYLNKIKAGIKPEIL